MDEATDNLILEILLQDSLEIYENEQAQITRAQVQQQDESFGTPEHSEELQGYDASVCRHVRRATKDDESSTLYEANNANATLSASGMPLGQDEHGKCCICLDSKLPAELVVLNCLHGYCRDCTNNKFEFASNNPLSFPPRCCGEPIALNLFQPFLRPEVVDHFKRKEVEYNTKNPIYCHISKCHKLIPSDNIEADRATCLSCGEMTCTICKSGVHDGDCPDDPALGPLMATATKEGWKVCPSCHRLIDRSAGCNHMTYVSYLYYISPRNNTWFSDVYAISNSVTFAELFGSNAPVHNSRDRTTSWPISVFIFQSQQPKIVQNVVFRDIFALESERLFKEAGMEIRTARA